MTFMTSFIFFILFTVTNAEHSSPLPPSFSPPPPYHSSNETPYHADFCPAIPTSFFPPPPYHLHADFCPAIPPSFSPPPLYNHYRSLHFSNKKPILIIKNNKSPPPPPRHNFDFFVLAERWPTTFCMTEICKNPRPAKFVIHGLWPSIDGPLDSQPRNCGQDSKLIIDYGSFTFAAKLQSEWPSIKKSTKIESQKIPILGDIELWSEQWDVHGTCSLMSPNDYFQLTLQIHHRLGSNLKDILRTENILAGGTTTIKSQDIVNAIKKYINFDPQIQCVQPIQGIGYYLNEIRICLEKGIDHNYKDCQKTFVNCPTDIYYP